jgi:hypothetical protein
VVEEGRGLRRRVFLDAANDSVDFQAARQAFVDSTLAAHKDCILPFMPHFDSRLALMLNPSDKLRPGPGYGAIEDWYGADVRIDYTYSDVDTALQRALGNAE